jgi:hypothetical protein
MAVRLQHLEQRMLWRKHDIIVTVMFSEKSEVVRMLRYMIHHN